MTYNLTDRAIIAHNNDNVAVAVRNIRAGTKLNYGDTTITLQDRIPRGHRFALSQIPRWQNATQYGHPFGTASKNIQPGQILWNQNARKHLKRYDYRVNFSDIKPTLNLSFPDSHCVAPTTYVSRGNIPKFRGYVRSSEPKKGKVGTRNYAVVINTSGCSKTLSSKIAQKIAAQFWDKLPPGLDSVVALDNDGGCECGPKRAEIVAEILANYARHPNVGGVLFVENGCEKTCFAKYKRKYREASHGKPVGFLSFQNDFGCNIERTVEAGVGWVRDHLDEVAATKRKEVPISYLNLGTQCGGSGGLSGFSGNAAVGALSDLLVRNHGTVILSEIPEIYGAHHILAARGKNAEVAREIIRLVEWYHQFADSGGEPLEANLGPGNIQEGLINLTLKSLGGIVKGGTTRVEGTLQYGERITKQGLWAMQGLGGDRKSNTGLVASGANVIAMTTSCGTPTGNPIVPVIKIVNTDKFKKADIFDYCSQAILSGKQSKEEAGKDLLQLVIKFTSGEYTRSEINEIRDFSIFYGKTVPL